MRVCNTCNGSGHVLAYSGKELLGCPHCHEAPTWLSDRYRFMVLAFHYYNMGGLGEKMHWYYLMRWAEAAPWRGQ